MNFIKFISPPLNNSTTMPVNDRQTIGIKQMYTIFVKLYNFEISNLDIFNE